ncbi:hypothetical protein ABRY77_16370 [Enterococcus casseliflavus]|uniref:hypothetical protein n=1 Tax=Enterococcus casseliflavus TaxID=37734 RepID=UPI003EE1BE90
MKKKASTDIEILESIKNLVSIIEDALAKEAIDAAFFCSLSIPDLMGQYHYPDLREETKKYRGVVSKRYVKWYDENVYKYQNPPIEDVDDDAVIQNINQFDGSIIYNIRCKLFHQGSILHRTVEEKINTKYKNLIGVEDDKLIINITFEKYSTSYGFSTNNYDEYKTVNININKRDIAKELMSHASHLININTPTTFNIKHIMNYPDGD